MKRYGDLFNQICTLSNLICAHYHARKDKSLYSAVQKTNENLNPRMEELHNLLEQDKYNVSLYHTSRKFDVNKTRILFKLPYFPDRIIQWAIMNIIEPLLRVHLQNFSCASISGRGIHYAFDLLKGHLRDDPEGTQYYLKIDIHKFYPSINQRILKEKLRTLFKDKALLKLLDKLIDSYNNTDIHHLHLTDEEKAIYCRPGYGIPIGSYLSQYLANFYLSDFDNWVMQQPSCTHVIRYMDDCVIFSDSKESLHRILAQVKTYLQGNLDLQIKSNYAINRISEGVDMLGYRFFPHCILLRKATKQRMIQVFKEVAAAEAITEHQWCSCISYAGILSWANTYKLAKKYYFPITPKLDAYYYKHKHGKQRKHFSSWKMYCSNYRKHNSYSDKLHVSIHRR